MSRNPPERLWLRHYRSNWAPVVGMPNSGDEEYVRADQLRTARAEALRDAAERLLSLARKFRNDGHYNQAYRVEALADDLVKAEEDDDG